MQLGIILSSASEPIVYRVIKFQVLAALPDQKQAKVTAEAALAFLSEEARQEANKLAQGTLKEGGDIDEERAYWTLMLILRDSQDPSRQFCPNAEYGKFRRALIVEQVNWLQREYRRFVADEYPELASPEQQAQLKEEATGN